MERDIGLSKDTLRIWEKRYGFPRPVRDAHGERTYSAEQVEKLRLLKQLIARGIRPGKIIGLAFDELEKLGMQQCTAIQQRPDLSLLLELLHEHDVSQFRRQLTQTLMRQGLHAFVLDTVCPLNDQVAALRLRGELELFEEHCYGELMQGVLRSAVHAIQHQGRAPCIVLASLSQRARGLTLLMTEAVLSVGGAICIPLGHEIPVRDVALAVGAHQADVVVLCLDKLARDTCNRLSELRSQLRPGISIWTSCDVSSKRQRKVAEGIHFVESLDKLPALLHQWQRDNGRQ